VNRLGTRQLLLHAVADPAKARPRRMRVMDELCGEELAVRSGVTAKQLRRLVELGIITPTPQGRYRPSDIQRIRVVDTLAEAGFAPEQLSELIATGAYDLDWASVVFPEPTAQLTRILELALFSTNVGWTVRWAAWSVDMSRSWRARRLMVGLYSLSVTGEPSRSCG
jgi:MerR HTH family regulatory protein